MKSRTTPRFRKAFDGLPFDIKKQARNAFRQFLSDPNHPSLRFKSVHSSEPIYSVRINASYRCLGVLNADTIVWFWIGSHDAYERLIS